MHGVKMQNKDVPPVAARQAEVARGYLKRAARIGELSGHPPGSEGPMATALKRYNGAGCWSSWWARSRRCQRT